jgi:uncharacterized protein YkwD
MLRVGRWFCGASLLLAAVTLAPHVRALQAEPGDAPRESEEGSRAASAPSTRQRTPAANIMTPDEWRFLELINRERTTRRMPVLKPDALLVEVAREHSREMCEKNYFDHASPTPGIRTPMDRYLKAVRPRPPHACVGENLFYCSIVDVDRGHRAFMNSPGHRANILYAPFRRGGVGIYKNDAGEFWVTEMFLTTEG